MPPKVSIGLVNLICSARNRSICSWLAQLSPCSQLFYYAHHHKADSAETIFECILKQEADRGLQLQADQSEKMLRQNLFK